MLRIDGSAEGSPCRRAHGPAAEGLAVRFLRLAAAPVGALRGCGPQGGSRLTLPHAGFMVRHGSCGNWLHRCAGRDWRGFLRGGSVRSSRSGMSVRIPSRILSGGAGIPENWMRCGFRTSRTCPRTRAGCICVPSVTGAPVGCWAGRCRRSQDSNRVERALRMAKTLRSEIGGQVVFHADRGAQYTSAQLHAAAQGLASFGRSAGPRCVGIVRRDAGIVLVNAENRVLQQETLADSGRGHGGDKRVDRGVLQPPPTPLLAGLPKPRRLRTCQENQRPSDGTSRLTNCPRLAGKLSSPETCMQAPHDEMHVDGGGRITATLSIRLA